LESYITVKQQASFEFEDRKSVFIADVSPVSTEADAIAFIASVKKRYPDARHHVYAYVLRENNAQRFSDDGEPHGTAGLPLLDTLRKQSITDAVIVVTRYFGGILLGTGGLVRAYSTAAKDATVDAGVVSYVLYKKIKISVSYSDYQKLVYFLDKKGIKYDTPSFENNVSLIAKILPKDTEAVFSTIADITGGRAIVSEEGHEYGA
jgi:uncharacterized YigZ family protein